MSTEKYIGEAALKGNPKVKLNLNLREGSITTEKIADAGITTEKIRDTSITTEKIAPKAVTNDKLADNVVDMLKIANESVSTHKLQDAAITTPKLADQSVTLSKLNTEVTERIDKAVASANEAAANANEVSHNPPKIGEDGYWYIFNEHTRECVKTEHYSVGGVDYPTFFINEDDGSLYVNLTKGTDEKRFYLKDGNLCLLVNQ